jgi:hypothetical protein
MHGGINVGTLMPIDMPHVKADFIVSIAGSSGPSSLERHSEGTWQEKRYNLGYITNVNHYR